MLAVLWAHFTYLIPVGGLSRARFHRRLETPPTPANLENQVYSTVILPYNVLTFLKQNISNGTLTTKAISSGISLLLPRRLKLEKQLFLDKTRNAR